jgi:predicted XRE-type DNA-binding protein
MVLSQSHPTLDIVIAQDNIFADLGFSEEEAINLKIRADLMLELRSFIKRQGWTQKKAAEFFKETQPRICNLINGDIHRFSIDKLLIMLNQAGMAIKFEILPMDKEVC